MPDFPPAVRAVDLGGFVQPRVDPRQRGHVDDRVPARFLPDVGEPDERPKPRFAQQRRDGVHPPHRKQLVDHAVGGEHVFEDACHNNPRNEMRKGEYRLIQLLDAGMPQLVERQRQYDGRGELQRQLAQAEDHGVPQGAQKFPVGKKLVEIVQPHPRAAPDAALVGKALKRQIQACHGYIAKHHVPDDQRQNQQIQHAAVPYPPPQGAVMVHPGRCRIRHAALAPYVSILCSAVVSLYSKKGWYKMG